MSKVDERGSDLPPEGDDINLAAPETRAAAAQSVREVLTPFVRGDSVALPGSIWIVTARAS